MSKKTTKKTKKTKKIKNTKINIWVENISDPSKIGQKKNFSSIFSMKPIYY